MDIKRSNSILRGACLVLVAVLAFSSFTIQYAFADSTKAVLTASGTTKPVPKVERLAGNDRYDTAIAVAEEFLRKNNLTKFKTVVLASGEGYADALSGSFFAYKKGGPIILIGKNNADEIISYVKEKLEENGRLYILGGPQAVTTKVETAFAGYKLKRIAGADRYETNLAILMNCKAQGHSDIAVCSGSSFGDALSTSAMPMPVLLVGKRLTNSQMKYLSGIGKKTFRVVGGDGAVVGAVWKGLKSYGTPKRYYGSNRYGTSAAVANRFFKKNGGTAYLVTGTNYADGIVAGPLALADGAPILLTAKNNAAYAYNYVYDKNASKVVVCGGTLAVDDKQVGKTQPVGFLNIGSTKNKYIIKSDGRMAQDEWITDEGTRYHAVESGIINRSSSVPIRGIDVSAYQKIIDWNRVKSSGIQFAIIRVGYRAGETGKIGADTYAKANVEGALRAGLKVGVYFFSQAVNAQEGKEEAEYVLKFLEKYPGVTMPVTIDSESVDSASGGGRHNKASIAQRTAAIEAFCERVKQAGKTPMIYSSTSWFNTKLDMTKLSKYNLWVADWRSKCYYEGDYVCWQDSSRGFVNGISGFVDTDWWYGGAL